MTSFPTGTAGRVITFERTVYNIFNKRCLEEYLNNSQFAYRSGGSCINALLKMQHTFLAALDKGLVIIYRLGGGRRILG